MFVKMPLVLLLIGFFLIGQTAVAGNVPELIKTPEGDIKLTLIGHGTIMMEYDDKVIHIDPWTKLADYSYLPKADIVLITHQHRDHLDKKAVDTVSQDGTRIVVTTKVKEGGVDGTVMKNGDTATVLGLKIEAVPAYNLVHKRDNGQPFHPKGEGNGYIITLGNTRVYIAGDTENTPEMKNLKNIDLAFLPMNLPYTMTPAMVADAARSFKPTVLYPYHYGRTNLDELIKLMDGSGVEVRVRDMK